MRHQDNSDSLFSELIVPELFLPIWFTPQKRIDMQQEKAGMMESNHCLTPNNILFYHALVENIFFFANVYELDVMNHAVFGIDYSQPHIWLL